MYLSLPNCDDGFSDMPDDLRQEYPQVIIINGKEKVQYHERGYDGRGPAYLMGKIDNMLKSKNEFIGKS